MRKESKRTLYICLGALVPLFTLFSPPFFSIGGVGPEWAVLWILPWALEEGPLSGIFAGFCLGMILDGISLYGATHTPALILLGYWWGLLGRKQKFFDKVFLLGLLGWLGSFISGIFLWLQNIFLVTEGKLFFYNVWSFHTILAASIMTGLIAPILCSIILRAFFSGKNLKVIFI